MNALPGNPRARGQAIVTGIVLGVPVLLLFAFLVSAHAVFTPRGIAAHEVVDVAAPGAALTSTAPADDPAPVPVAAVPAPVRPPEAAPAARTVARTEWTRRVAVVRAVPAIEVAIPEVTFRLAGGPECGAGGQSASSRKSYAYGYSMDDDSQRGFRWALVDPNGDGDGDGIQSTGNTDQRAYRAIKRAARTERGRFLYFRLDGRDHIVRDPELLARASRLVEPMRELGRKMGELGGRQGELGGQQGRLGGEQGRLGAQQARLAAREMALQARIHSRDLQGLSTADLEDERDALAAERDRCSQRMRELGRRQSELGARQSKLGAQQSRLGEEMRKLSDDAERSLRELARNAIEHGKAKAISEVDV